VALRELDQAVARPEFSDPTRLRSPEIRESNHVYPLAVVTICRPRGWHQFGAGMILWHRAVAVHVVPP